MNTALSAHKAQAYLLYLLGTAGTAGWMAGIDITPYGMFCGILIGVTEHAKSKQLYCRNCFVKLNETNKQPESGEESK